MGVYSAKKIKGSAPSAPGGGHQFLHLCSRSFLRGASSRSPAPWALPPSLRVRGRVQGLGVCVQGYSPEAQRSRAIHYGRSGSIRDRDTAFHVFNVNFPSVPSGSLWTTS